MHCNQPSCGNVFNNGQNFGYNIYNPPLPNNGIYSEIVGEGEVTSVALPDGTFQLFFIPRVKWWSPYPANRCPLYTNIVNGNHQYSGSLGPNVGAWFVRTIINPTPAAFTAYHQPLSNLPPSNQCPYEAQIPFYSSNCQLKFHNDCCTSTTDLHYFYPHVRQLDCTLTLPAQGCAAIQVNTPTENNTVPHYEFMCAKPCHCASKQCHVPTTCRSASAMSLEDTPSLAKLNRSNKSGSKCKITGKSSSTDICSLPFLDKTSRSIVSSKHNVPICSQVSKMISKDDCKIDPLGKSNDRSSLSMPDKENTSREVTCECAEALAERSRSRCKQECSVCKEKQRKSESHKVICECDEALAERNRSKCKHECRACKETYRKTKSNEVICECAEALAERSRSRCKQECSVCRERHRKTGSIKVTCECAEALAERFRSKCRHECSVCKEKQRKSESHKVICECDEALAERNRSKCKHECRAGKETYRKIESNEFICECAEALTERIMSRCKHECSVCKETYRKTESNGFISECAKVLGERIRSKCKHECSVCKERHRKTGLNEVNCECAEALAQRLSSKCKHECRVCKEKNKRRDPNEVICECAGALAERIRSKCKYECSVCKEKHRKSELDVVVCECAKVLAKLNKPKRKCICCRCVSNIICVCTCKCCVCGSRNSKSESNGIICECAQLLAKRNKSRRKCCVRCCKDTKTKSNGFLCKYSWSFLAKPSSSRANSTCCGRGSKDNVQKQLLPADERRKRIRLDRPERGSESKSKDAMCECTPPQCSNKSITTYINQSSGPSADVQTQSCCEQSTAEAKSEDFVYRCKVEPEIWRPVTAMGRKSFVSRRPNNNFESSCSSCTCSDCRDTDEG